MFQIMGFNHEVCGFETVQAFVEAHEKSEKEHLAAFLKYLENTRAGDGRPLLRHLQSHEWATFARAYNGPGYKQNQYDIKLKNAYEKFAA